MFGDIPYCTEECAKMLYRVENIPLDSFFLTIWAISTKQSVGVHKYLKFIILIKEDLVLKPITCFTAFFFLFIINMMRKNVVKVQWTFSAAPKLLVI